MADVDFDYRCKLVEQVGECDLTISQIKHPFPGPLFIEDSVNFYTLTLTYRKRSMLVA
jgi:hypothetical protein